MRTEKYYKRRILNILIAIVFMVGIVPVSILANPVVDDDILPDTLNTIQYRGKIIDSESGAPLVFATLTIEGTNIATVSNSEGDFLLKVPKEMPLNTKISVSYLGYKGKSFVLSDLKPDKNKLKLDLLTISLSEINVAPKDAHQIIREVISRKKENYIQEPLRMTTFYRETIKRRRNYVSLAEAVIDVHKQPYSNYRLDGMKLFKARKDADYSKMDTLTFKLQGGPYSTLMLDIMKEPYSIITVEEIDYYIFKLENITKVNNRLIYVISFEQKPYVEEPLFYGRLYIDVESMAISSANYSINIEDKNKASAMFIKRKPVGAVVYPTEASYLVNYRQHQGKWMYGYSRGQITFKINWKKKLFNTSYTSTIEMAVTDWRKATERPFKVSERLNQNIILQDKVAGFSDPQFWGDYNVIEPEASIESVIKKIKKRLDKVAESE
ncbi:carboxypeptidase-like regulatory domain-containing protein [Plebeiibacterium marinum]|uniref:Carboxypeptidase-like regulatory domain-containing protein n=1 Tax=Plebeiibacterium marinum TaxID=2992111 RepID=A0AAE3MH20_9BACT|nr:carboxypeptidase-like regulatory domain-containing protein [Plebeiobacterium marinum]MCW3807456.1 carboxypeptidase-like regulatory domain-containing protein [Plebeiobacterium marinum]